MSVDTISKNELGRRLEQGDAPVIVEALPEMHYRKWHLPGALNIPLSKVEELAPALLPDQDAEIVVYCSSYSCGSSGKVAAALEELGYGNVRRYEGGKKEWLEAELPVEKGSADVGLRS